MTWKIVNAQEEFERYSAVLDELNKSLFQGHPLMGSVFVGCLLKHFGSSCQLLALHTSANDVNGMAVLGPRKRGVWSTFVPSQAPVAPAVVPAGVDLKRLLHDLPGFNLVVEWLNQDPLYSRILSDLSQADIEKEYQLTTMNIDMTGPFEDYWAARGKKLRSNVSRYVRRVEKDGFDCRLDIVESEQGLLDALTRYGNLESAGWKGAQNTAIHRDNEQGRFYADILTAFAKTGQARMYELFYNETLVASRISVNSDDVLVMLKTTYDESFSKLAPGRILLYLLLEREFSAGKFKTIEFYTNATKDQISWATATRDMYHVTQHRSRLTQQLTQKAKRIRKSLRRG